MTVNVGFEVAGDAADLQARLELTASLLGVVFGGKVLDVGGAPGLYVPTLHDAGFERVVVVDPKAGQAVQNGVVPEGDAFRETLQAYVRRGLAPADAACVLNMQPELSGDATFVDALTRSVAPGCLIVASMSEPTTSMRFRTMMERHSDVVTRRGVAPPSAIQPLLHTGPNCYIQLWQRNP